jgi:hypothetical protein
MLHAACAHANILALPLGQHLFWMLPERWQAQQHGKSSNEITLNINTCATLHVAAMAALPWEPPPERGSQLDPCAPKSGTGIGAMQTRGRSDAKDSKVRATRWLGRASRGASRSHAQGTALGSKFHGVDNTTYCHTSCGRQRMRAANPATDNAVRNVYAREAGTVLGRREAPQGA